MSAPAQFAIPWKRPRAIVRSISSSESVATVEQWRQAGGTWWIESPWSRENDFDYLRARIAAGPPR